MLGPSACRAPLPDSRDRDPDPGLGGHPSPPGRHPLQGADTEPAQVRLPHQPPLRPQRRVSPCPGGPALLLTSGVQLVHVNLQTTGCHFSVIPPSCLFLEKRLSVGAACAMGWPRAAPGSACCLNAAACPTHAAACPVHTAVLPELPGRVAVTLESTQ